MKKPLHPIRRKKFVPAPPERTIIATAENTTVLQLPPRNHPLYALVGEISMRWSFLEELLDTGIGTLAGIDAEITACITAQMMGHAPRCLTIIALAHWRGMPDVEEATKKLMSKLFEVSELRNRAIHDRLLIETKNQKTFRNHRMAKGQLRYGLSEFDSKELERVLSIIEDRRKECAGLVNLIREQVYEDVE